jgi:hypothetical protein
LGRIGKASKKACLAGGKIVMRHQMTKRIEGEIRALKTTLEWVIQNGMNEENGVMFRILIAGWIYLEWMREMTLTELATMYGKDKQSFGRWVDDFKLRFPEVRTHNMKIE